MPGAPSSVRSLLVESKKANVENGTRELTSGPARGVFVRSVVLVRRARPVLQTKTLPRAWQSSTSAYKKLPVTASLLGARTLLVAPGLTISTTSNKRTLVTKGEGVFGEQMGLYFC